jgi:hypothetical protein
MLDFTGVFRIIPMPSPKKGDGFGWEAKEDVPELFRHGLFQGKVERQT